MKIGDEVYIHGYVDEIRNGTVIIRNDGGYFGTVPEEILTSVQLEPSQIARDIATIIENEQDMRVIQENAQPERKRGKWIELSKDEPYYYMCDQCYERTDDKSAFCPGCGAYMRGVEEIPAPE